MLTRARLSAGLEHSRAFADLGEAFARLGRAVWSGDQQEIAMTIEILENAAERLKASLKNPPTKRKPKRSETQ